MTAAADVEVEEKAVKDYAIATSAEFFREFVVGVVFE